MQNKTEMKRYMIRSIPYLFFGFFCMNLGEAWRLAEGYDYTEKMQSFFNMIPVAFQNVLPGFYAIDLLWGIVCGGLFWAAVKMKSRMRKSTGMDKSTVQQGGVHQKISHRMKIRCLKTTSY